MLPIPTQLLVGPKAPSGKKTIVLRSAATLPPRWSVSAQNTLAGESVLHPSAGAGAEGVRAQKEAPEPRTAVAPFRQPSVGWAEGLANRRPGVRSEVKRDRTVGTLLRMQVAIRLQPSEGCSIIGEGGGSDGRGGAEG